MKKLSMFQIILLVVFGGLAVAGVLIFALAIGGGNSSSVGTVVIWGTLDATEFNAVLRQAADQNTSLNQTTYVQKDPATYEQDLTQALASGTGPDLFIITQDYAVKNSGEAVVIPLSSVSQSQFANTFVDAAQPFSTSQGTIGIPILADPLVLYWNKDMLAAAGYSEPPQYWDQLQGMAQQVTQKDTAGDISRSAIAFGEYQNVDDAKAILSTLILQAGGAITAYDSSSKLVSALQPKTGGASSTAAAGNALNFYTGFVDPSQAYYSWNGSLPDAQQDFTQGDLAMYVGYSSEESAIAHGNPNLNFSVAPLPQVRSAQNPLDFAQVYAFVAARAGKNPNGAVTVAGILSSPTNAAAFSTAFGLPSARRDVLSAETPSTSGIGNALSTAPSEGQVIAGAAAISQSWIDPDPDATATIFQDMIENTTSGTLLYNEAIQRADQQLSQLISTSL